MLPDDREGMSFGDTSSAALAEHSDEFVIPTPEDPEAPELRELREGVGAEDEREWFGKHPAYPRNTPDDLHTPDLTTRFYVGLWLPGAGALLTYALMHGNYWAAFVGIELLLVGWFTLAKL
jgi:hypothetical protein